MKGRRQRCYLKAYNPFTERTRVTSDSSPLSTATPLQYLRNHNFSTYRGLGLYHPKLLIKGIRKLKPRGQPTTCHAHAANEESQHKQLLQLQIQCSYQMWDLVILHLSPFSSSLETRKEVRRIREWHEAKDRAGKGKVATIQVELCKFF